MQPRLSKVKGYLESTMPLLFSFALIFPKKEPKALSEGQHEKREGICGPRVSTCLHFGCQLAGAAGGWVWGQPNYKES